MKFGLTQQFTCSYLPEQQEQLLVYVSDTDINTCTKEQYEVLISNGFRRSGDQVYRPHCPACNACQSIRIPVEMFRPSKAQTRIINKNKDIRMSVSNQDREEYYQLYQKYINTRHRDGSMYPASLQQYRSFIGSGWIDPLFLEFHKGDNLVAVAVTDLLEHALSALYTFFDPEYAQRSLGLYAITRQIDYASQLKKPFVYLGYQVDACQKMRYKSKFMPHQRFFDNKWQLISKKPV